LKQATQLEQANLNACSGAMGVMMGVISGSISVFWMMALPDVNLKRVDRCCGFHASTTIYGV